MIKDKREVKIASIGLKQNTNLKLQKRTIKTTILTGLPSSNRKFNRCHTQLQWSLLEESQKGKFFMSVGHGFKLGPPITVENIQSLPKNDTTPINWSHKLPLSRTIIQLCNLKDSRISKTTAWLNLYKKMINMRWSLLFLDLMEL